MTTGSTEGGTEVEAEKIGAKVLVERVPTEAGIFVLEISPVYQIKTVAKIMDVTTSSVRVFIRRGELKSFETKAGRRINHADLIEFLEGYYDPAPRNANPNAGFHKAMAARGITNYRGALVHGNDDDN